MTLDVLPFAALALAEEPRSRRAALAGGAARVHPEYAPYAAGRPASVRYAFAKILSLLLSGEKEETARVVATAIAEAGDYVTLLNFLRTSPTPLNFDAYCLLQAKRRERKALGAMGERLADEERKRRQAEGKPAADARISDEEFGLFLYFAGLLDKPIADGTERFAAQFANAIKRQQSLMPVNG